MALHWQNEALYWQNVSPLFRALCTATLHWQNKGTSLLFLELCALQHCTDRIRHYSDIWLWRSDRLSHVDQRLWCARTSHWQNEALNWQNVYSLSKALCTATLHWQNRALLWYMVLVFRLSHIDLWPWCTGTLHWQKEAMYWQNVSSLSPALCTAT